MYGVKFQDLESFIYCWSLEYWHVGGTRNLSVSKIYYTNVVANSRNILIIQDPASVRHWQHFTSNCTRSKYFNLDERLCMEDNARVLHISNEAEYVNGVDNFMSTYLSTGSILITGKHKNFNGKTKCEQKHVSGKLSLFSKEEMLTV